MPPEQRALVGFVGAALRPEPATVLRLAEAGVHGTWLADAVAAAAAARLAVFDAVLVDAALATPLALFGLREGFAGPLIVVGTRADEIDEVLALECGADAWLHGPLAPRRLLAHLQAQWRLSRRQGTMPLPARFAGWALCRVSGRLSGHGHSLSLAQTQARLLAVMMDAAGRPVSRHDLRATLPRGDELEPRAVDVYVSRLRLRLAQERVQQLRVQPVRGCGYALECGAAAGPPLPPEAAEPPLAAIHERATVRPHRPPPARAAH